MRQDAFLHNPWFSPGFTAGACLAWSELLQPGPLQDWISAYPKAGALPPRRIGIIMAGNIPLAGLHDLVSVIITGHAAMARPSSKDSILLPHLVKKLIEAEPGLQSCITLAGTLKDIDAVIATGSDTSASRFRYYFRNIPHLVRHNRNSVAVLTGIETREELLLLGKDIFTYFGLGCRNISKLFIPEGYDPEPLLETLGSFGWVMENRKYKNNYDYNLTLLIINKTPHFHNDFLMLTENPALSSPVACLHFEYYSGAESLTARISGQMDSIQCIAVPPGSHFADILPGGRTVPFGETQRPRLGDYADGDNTLEFLLS